MSAEQWRPVTGYEGVYEVSSHGRVRSLKRVVSRGAGALPVRGRVLAGGANKEGYPVVTLHRDGTPSSRTIHTLVAEAFIGPRPVGMDVCHNDGGKTNNFVENLRYDTRSANLVDAVRHGVNWNTRKTECPRGHEYSGRNLKWKDAQRKHRSCRACTQERTSAHHSGRDFDPVRAEAIYHRQREEDL